MLNTVFTKFLILSIIFLILTGLRIWFFNQSSLPPFYLSWIDSVSVGGNIFSQHLHTGYLLIGLIILKSTLEAWRLTKIRHLNSEENILWQIKSWLVMALYTLIAALIVSGIAIYYAGFSETVTLTTFQNIHSFSTWAVIAVAAVYIVVWVLSRRKTVRSDKVSQIISKPNFVWTSLSVIIAISLVWLVFHFVEKPQVLVSKNIYRRIALNGIEGLEWTGADSLIVNLSNGANFPGGVTRLKVKSFYSRREIHFLFQWRDWEQSYNRSIEKTTNGWRELKSEYSPFGETVYFEDQFAITFHTTQSGCAQSCHIGQGQRSGLHYTDGDTADIWQWQAASTNPAWEADDGWWNGYVNDSIGGRHFDNSPGSGNVLNLNEEWDEPYFLPGPFQYGNWIWMEADKYIPYRASLDNFRIGSILPSRLVNRFTGDRGDLNARARWKNGTWTLEITRNINTGSRFDMSLRKDCWIGIAVFNNAQTKHAYHLKPIKLAIE